MNDFVWPVVVCVIAMLAFLRLKPAAPVRLKRMRQLEAKVKRLERQRTELLGELETRAKAHADELVVIKGQVADRLNAFSEDMSMLKQEFSTIKTKAGFKAVVERHAQPSG